MASLISKKLKTRAIVVTGPTSSGKTSAAKALQEALLPEVWTHFSVDTLIDGLPLSVLDRCNRNDDWSGVDGPRLFSSSVSCLRMLVEEGNSVIFDAVIPSEKRGNEMRSKLEGVDFLSVFLQCGWEDIERRTVARADRTMSEARRSFEQSQDHIGSELVIDSSGKNPPDIAREILAFMKIRENDGFGSSVRYSPSA